MSNIILHKPAELQVMADNVYQSGMFGLKNKNQVYTLMLIAQSEGLHPIEAVQQYNVINGLPAMKTIEKHTRFNKSGGKLKWIETTDKIAKAEMTHPSYEGIYLSEFTIEEASLMGLLSKDNWKKMPKKMLMARCLSSGINAIAPDCLGNVKYTVEDMQDGLVEVEISKQEDEIIMEVEESTYETRFLANKAILSTKLRKYDFSDAMIKEFATVNDLINNKVLIDELVNDEAKLIELIKEFEK